MHARRANSGMWVSAASCSNQRNFLWASLVALLLRQDVGNHTRELNAFLNFTNQAGSLILNRLVALGLHLTDLSFLFASASTASARPKIESNDGAQKRGD